MLSEDLIDTACGLSGAGPAYIYLFIEALADGGVACGLPRDKATAYAAQTLLGSAKLLLETGRHPGELQDMVCSPGGTTIEAVNVYNDNDISGITKKAIDACVKRAKELENL